MNKENGDCIPFAQSDKKVKTDSNKIRDVDDT